MFFCSLSLCIHHACGIFGSILFETDICKAHTLVPIFFVFSFSFLQFYSLQNNTTHLHLCYMYVSIRQFDILSRLQEYMLLLQVL